MNGESLISWNLPNFITIVFMLAIIWVVIGAAGHIFVRRPAQRAATVASTQSVPNSDNTNTAFGGVIVA